MTAATQTAAYESVDDMLGAPPGRQTYHAQSQDPRDFPSHAADHGSSERAQAHQGIAQGHDRGVGGQMPPPPPPRPGYQSSSFGLGEP